MARVSLVAVKRIAIALGWVVLFAALAVGVTILLADFVPGWGGREWFITRNGAYELVGTGLATFAIGRWLNRRTWFDLGWRPPEVAGGALGRGLALGAAMACVAIALAALLDGAQVRITHDAASWAGIALPLLIGLVLAALAEELLFRGYPLRRLAEALGTIPAMLLLALLFGLAHARNPSATVFSTINVALAAIWLSFAFFSAGGMPLAWGAHLGWNAALAILFDAPVSGYAFHVPVVEYTPGAHAWVDGGAFGPEGGIVSTIALIAGTLFLLSRPNAFKGQPSSSPDALYEAVRPLPEGEGVRG